MLVTKSLLTACTVVEVLADGALVAQALDRGHATAITRDIGVND